MRARMVVASMVTLMVVLLATPIAAKAQVGPSFPCPQPNDPLANLICSSPALSRDDLKMVQAYQALWFSLSTSGRDDLIQQSIAFTENVTDGCGIPTRGSGLSALPSVIPCVDEYYRRQRDVYAARLTGAPAQEVNRPLAQHTALQQDLQALGFLPRDAAIDGDYGPATRAAIEAWQQSRGLDVTGFLGDADASLLADEGGNSTPARAKNAASPTASQATPPVAPPPFPAQPPAGPREAQTSVVLKVPLKEEGGTFVVPVQINGAITLDFVVDSGATDVQIPIDVFSTLVRARTIVPSDMIGEQTYTLADGSTQKEPRFVVRQLKVGTDIFRNVPASVSPFSGGLLLGQSFLSRFAEWTLDNQQHVLRLVEKSKEPPGQILLPSSVSGQPGPLATAAMPAAPHQPATGGRRFEVTACGSILDTATHLEWYLGPDANITWPNADKWIKKLRACNGAWAMPSADQLRTLFDPSVVAGIGYFTGGQYWPAHIDPIFSGIGKGSWVWARGPHNGNSAPGFNFNQGVKVEISSTDFYGTVRVFAVRLAE